MFLIGDQDLDQEDPGVGQDVLEVGRGQGLTNGKGQNDPEVGQDLAVKV